MRLRGITSILLPALLLGGISSIGKAQSASDGSPVSEKTVQELLKRLSEDEARIKDLEAKLNGGQQNTAPASSASANSAGNTAASTTQAPTAAAPAANTSTASTEAMPQAVSITDDSADPAAGGHDHMMELPGGGPSLKFRGFFDFDAGVGPAANHLIYPLDAPARATFQSGEFDLFMSSQLSPKLSFISELVIGSDPTNEWGLDIERLQLTYKQSKYFEISGGRYHSAIGYYNTAFHHGTWFQTATGRPFMYYFEDSGGLLPVHNVGATATGLVPGTDRLGLHWIAEVGNGRSSDKNLAPVQNFLSDRDRKSYNFAAYIAPERFRGLQIGGSYYNDKMTPPNLFRVKQSIESAYAIYINSDWELLNEAVLLNNTPDLFGARTFHTPMAYSQISHRWGMYRPYFRYQYLNSPKDDPINIFTGRYMGPSVGLRVDFSDYAAFKVQYNRVDLRDANAQNGVDAQVAFTF